MFNTKTNKRDGSFLKILQLYFHITLYFWPISLLFPNLSINFEAPFEKKLIAIPGNCSFVISANLYYPAML